MGNKSSLISVYVQEIFEKEIKVQAYNFNEAQAIVKRKYLHSEITLKPKDHKATKFLE